MAAANPALAASSSPSILYQSICTISLLPAIYSFIKENVGLDTVSSTPITLHIVEINVVLPAPMGA